MNVIQVNQTSATMHGAIELLWKKEIETYKSAKDYEVYKIKNTDLYICIVGKDVKLFSNHMQEINYNTNIFKNLYYNDNLNIKNLINLYELKLFM